MTFKTILTLLSILLFGCRHNRTDMAAEQTKILEMHRAQRAYHFNKDAEAFVDQLADDFISVNRGEVSMPSYDESRSRYQNYFNSVEFVQWDDIRDPVIRFSDDGSMAYTVVQKKVVVRFINEEGERAEESTRFAWTSIYRKKNGNWQIEHVASTSGPSEITPVNN